MGGEKCSGCGLQPRAPWCSGQGRFWCLALRPPQQPKKLQSRGKEPLLKPAPGNTGFLQLWTLAEGPKGRGPMPWLLYRVTSVHQEAEKRQKKKERGWRWRVVFIPELCIYRALIKFSKQSQKAGFDFMLLCRRRNRGLGGLSDMLKVTQLERSGAISNAGLSDPTLLPWLWLTSHQAEAQRQALEQGL